MRIEKLIPEFKDYIWGGNKLKAKYGKVTDKTPCAESWELSVHKDGMSKLKNGKTLAECMTEKELGSNLRDFEFFPVMIKLIDAKDDLSVQVHPSDDYALKEEHSFGKSEMWFILEAEEGAGIYLGFKKDTTKEEFLQVIKENRLTELMNFYTVKPGESYFIPSGTLHAIGKGCLICEIQQNSNLTYRVYDYGRKDRNGKERELHTDKALRVVNLSKFVPRTFNEDYLGLCKYFTVRKLDISGSGEAKTDGTTFKCLTCVKGAGKVDNLSVKAGESCFVPADYGKFALSGEMTLIETEIRRYYIGIDIGGTYIKGGVICDDGKIIVKDKIATRKTADDVISDIALFCNRLINEAGLEKSDISGIGMGVPGTVDCDNKEVVYSNNLGWEHVAIGKKLEELVSVKVRMANDANAAALGEAEFGSGKGFKNSVFITLGTGVGSGIIADGKLFGGNRSAGAELGHSVIALGGESCSCGRRGCLEAYVSATALIRDTKRAMLEDRGSLMWEIGDTDKVTGKTAFDYMDEDKTARKVIDGYIEKLGIGLTNIANEFRPEAIIIGGGVCEQGMRLIAPLQQIIDRDIFGGDKGPRVKILKASLANDAGILGAAALWITP